MKNKKSQFLQAVELLAPGEKLVRELAKSIPENLLPAYPGATALEFVAGLHGLKTGRACPRRSRLALSSGVNPRCQPARPCKMRERRASV